MDSSCCLVTIVIPMYPQDSDGPLDSRNPHVCGVVEILVLVGVPRYLDYLLPYYYPKP